MKNFQYKYVVCDNIRIIFSDVLKFPKNSPKAAEDVGISGNACLWWKMPNFTY